MKSFVFALGLLMVCVGLHGDVLQFKNGDRLTGKLLNMTEGKVQFKSATVGKISAKLGDIQSLSTDEAIEIHLLDGKVVNAAVTVDQNNRMHITPATGAGRELALTDIAAINPPKPKVTWSGSVSAGFSSTHGNSFSENAALSFNLMRRGINDRFTAFSRYLVTRAKDKNNDKKTTEESFIAGGKYDYFYSKKGYGFVDGSFKKDHVADLDRRIIGGLGSGYQWLESKKQNFSTDFGLSIIHERYIKGEEMTTSDNMSIRAGYHYDRLLREGLDFIHELTYYPSATSSISDYFLSTNAELRVALTKSMFSSFKVLMDYDSTPAKDLGSTDMKYILSVGLNF